ncbi:B-cell receptor CD22-like [Phyllobates terribilis]|uniref:B-cell receptor CD22-like n=1 Tax=Phyllobates terribilis TaxID=111132 RepID=UPI003CCAD4D6
MDNNPMWKKLNFLVLVFLFKCDINRCNNVQYVNLANNVHAWNGSCAILPCSIKSYVAFDYYMWFFNPVYNPTEKDFTGKIIYQSKMPSQSDTYTKLENVVHIGKEERDCTIVITNLQKEDTGYYQLRLIGKRTAQEVFKWMSKSNLTLSVSHTSPSLKFPTVPEMQENKTVTLTCSIDYYCPYYNMSLIWLQDVKGDVKIYTKNDTSGISVTTTLTFIPSSEDHNKNISCILQRMKEETEIKTIKLDVKYAPQNVQIMSESPIKLIEGNMKTLSCSVESSNPPDLKITWYKDEEIFNAETNDLQLQCKESGKYYCKAENSVGTRYSNTVEISVLHPPKNVLIQRPMENIEEGSLVTLTCSTVANPQVSLYIWYKDDRQCFNSTKSHYLFHSITKDDSGFYQCEAINDQGHNFSTAVQLDVKYAPRNVKVVVKPDMKQFREGTEVIFECIVNSSNPEVTNTAWQQNNKFVASFSKRKIIKETDAGTYTCKATNEIGTSTSDEVSVEVLYPPKNSMCTIVNGNKIKEGDQVTLQCKSKQSNPVISRYEWFKGENLYETTNSDFLKLINLQWTDAEYYSCNATNTLGSSKGKCKYLYINYSPKNVAIKVSPGNSVTENTKVQLSCTATTPRLDNLMYYWYHNNQPLPKYQKEYALASIQMSHAGEYYCVVQNDVGSNKSQVMSLHVSYSSSTIGMYSASGIVSLIILMIFVALIVRFSSRLKTCRKTERSDLSFFVLKKPRSELSDQLDQHASSEDSLDERINYASLQFPAFINRGQSQSRAKASHPDPDPDPNPNDIYSVVKKPTATAEYENIESSEKTQDKSQDDIHYSVITNLNRGTTVRERGPETEYAMLKQ